MRCRAAQNRRGTGFERRSRRADAGFTTRGVPSATYAYSKRNLRGPSLNGLFKKQFMTNGMPANDDRVTDIILLGRAKMPAFQQKLTQQQLDDLMAYLHTL